MVLIAGWRSEDQLEEDNIYRRMTAHDAARIKRLTSDRGHFTNCRHYIRIKDRSFECIKRGKVKDCNGCFTCPNCNGLMFTHSMSKIKSVILDQEGIPKKVTYVTHAKSCVICGAYIEEQYIAFSERIKQDKSDIKCQVEGCTHSAYEGHEYIEAGQTFRICITHRNRIRSWKQHPDKGDDQRPIMLHKGRLVDNPDYKIKQAKRK